MPNTKAPMTSEGPIGAMAPPKPGTSAATGTMAAGGDGDEQQAAEEPVGLAAHDQTPPRGGEAELGLEEDRAERKAEHQQRRGRRLAVDQDERDQHRERQHRGDQERPVETRQRAARRVGCAAIIEFVATVLDEFPSRSQSAYEPRPSAFFRSSSRVREPATGRCGSAVHSTIEPSYSRTSGRPSTADSTNQSVAAQCPVLQ